MGKEIIMTYGNKETVKEEIKKLEEVQDVDLLPFIHLFDDRKKILNENQRNCKSDYSYWGFVAQEEETRCIIEYLEERLINYLKDKSPRIRELLSKENHLSKLRKNKEEAIKNLDIYKPINHKKIKDLLNVIFESEGE